MSVPKASSPLPGRAAALGGLARVSSSMPRPKRRWGKGWLYGQEPRQIQARTPNRWEEGQEEGSRTSSHPRHGWAQVSQGGPTTTPQSTGRTYPAAAPPFSPTPALPIPGTGGEPGAEASLDSVSGECGAAALTAGSASFAFLH